ncbi:MAG: ribosomal protection-like ABC-F family protein [Lachnospiraceae bacterium]
MNILTAEHLTKSYTGRMLFEDASFFLHEGEKVGILGINGTGKSTLLKILAGMEEPDEGKVIRANHIVVRYLPQHPSFSPGHTVLEAVLDVHKGDDTLYNLEADVKTMLTKLGIADYEQKIEELSGGQKKRVALVAALAAPSDVLILDEPTNHLDHAMADYLEGFLKKWRGALIMVTHDRYFLDSVSDRIVEIDKGKIYSYETNYSGFLKLKSEREASALATERKRQSILRVELEWMMRGARARSTKQKAHIQRYENLKNQEAPKTDGKVEITSVSSRMGRTTIELNGLTKSYGDKVLFKDFSYIFLKNDRIGFLGTNGCGKTTLMKVIAGMIEPDEGTVTVGQTIKIGYYTQEIVMDPSAGIAYMDPKMRVIDYIRQTAEYVITEDGRVSASKMLERFLFPPEEQYNLIEKLSGGEKRRLNLLRVLMEAPNVLILDEPTNDLDVTTLTILEDYLDHFDGIVITVSHDRYFLDRIVRRIFAFDGRGNLVQHEGGYTDYAARTALEEETAEPKAPPKKGVDTRVREKKLKFTYQEQKDFEVIEDEIAALEEKIEELEMSMNSCASDFVKLNEIVKEKEEAEALLEQKMDRWMYLEDLKEKIDSQAKTS